MVTGDNLLTARAIALECGIINPDNKDSIVMNGIDFITSVGGGIFYIFIFILSGLYYMQNKIMRLSYYFS